MNQSDIQPAVLCICDGWGCAAPSPGNAITLARTPNFDRLLETSPHTTLTASGLAVGLPDGQQGNSEVGHLTIGAGRVVRQDLTRIDQAIAEGSFFTNPVLVDAMQLSLDRGSYLHLMGLVSSGGVHSYDAHLVALCEMAKRMGLERVAIDAFTDGRDTPPTSGAGRIKDLLEHIGELGVGRLASLTGRYFAMDRDGRWDRTELAYQTLLAQIPTRVTDPLAYIDKQYADGVTDEFLPPALLLDDAGETHGLAEGDVVIDFNFRPDRARQLCHALVDAKFSHFDRGARPSLAELCTFTRYDDTLDARIAFPKSLVSDTLAEVVADAGLKQFHVAETEKYAHVTYFLNGGREDPFPNEERLLVPSPKAATYDDVPEMSARPITQAVLDHLAQGEASLIAVNYANADMVGHTGDLAATVAAVAYLDRCIGELVEGAASAGYQLLITADHGNAEVKVDLRDGTRLTSHTKSPVPLILADAAAGFDLRDGGGLEDVAPTLLALMGLEIPTAMTGHDLREKVSG